MGTIVEVCMIVCSHSNYVLYMHDRPGGGRGFLGCEPPIYGEPPQYKNPGSVTAPLGVQSLNR